MKFGIARIDITPQKLLSMDGFFDRIAPSKGTLNPLYATAYVIEANKNKVAIVCVDVLGIDQTLLFKVQQKVSKKTTLADDAILLNASHTHAAPAASRFGDMGSFFKKANPTQEDLAYYDQLAKNIAQAIIEADATLQEGTIYFNQTEIEHVSSNRVNKEAPFNQTASIFLFNDNKENTVGLLTLFANHPTILGPNNLYYSNDFISYFNQYIESNYANIISGYLQGCAGEISSRYIKKESSSNEAKRIGELLAQQVIEALNKKSLQLKDHCSIKTLPITFDIREFYPADYYKTQLLEAEKEYQLQQTKTNDPKVLRSAYVTLEGKRMIARMQQEIDIDRIESSMSCLALGDVTIITTPGETFGTIEKAIQAIDDRKILVMGYTNGYVGYLPDRESYLNPNVYEANMAPVHPNSPQLIIKTAKKLML